MTTLNNVVGLVVGQYGSVITLTVVDADGVAVDISSYTGIALKARSPDGQTTLSFSGSLVGGGTGGQFSITPTSENTFDREGTWQGQVQFSATGVLSLTVPFTMKVERRL